MAKSAYRTWVPGETVTAAQFNEQIRDNGNAIWVGTTAGDMDYYTSSTEKARLAGGTANAGICLRMDAGGTAPEYGGIVSARQGGTATNWNVAGTTDYETTKTIIQTGVIDILKFNTTYGTVQITFPKPFATIPIVFTQSLQFSGMFTRPTTVTTTTATLVYNVGEGVGDPEGLYTAWLAIGEVA